jgi:hypothetical protein
MVAVLAAWAITQVSENLTGKRPKSHSPGERPPDRHRLQSAVAVAGGALAALALSYAIVEGLDRRWLELRANRAELRLPVADGVRVEADERVPLERTVNFVRSHTRPGEPVYVATRRSDLVTAGAPILYVLAERSNPTRYDIAAPGVITTEAGQREIVRDLERSGTRLVVRWTDPVSAAPEPNKAGESSGVTLLDDYLARAYTRTARFGSYVLLERR